MADCVYSYAADFLNGLNSGQLYAEIKAEADISAVIVGIAIDSDVVAIRFDRALESAEQSALDVLVAAHVPRIPEVAPFTLTRIQTENTVTGGNYMLETLTLVGLTGPNSTTSYDFSWPMPLSTIAFHYTSEELHRGSSFTAMVAPNTIIGYLTAPGYTGTHLLSVSSTVIDNVMVGYYLDLFTGYSSENLGRVLAIDRTNHRVTVENAVSHTYAPYPAVYVRLTVHLVQNYVIGPPAQRDLGLSKMTASYLPAGTVARIAFTNHAAQTATLLVDIEYFY